MAICPKCNDTGVIETGNNDLPCDCPAGDSPVFNTVWGEKTGAELRAELKMPSKRDMMLVITCASCGHRYILEPVVVLDLKQREGVYSSDKDFCKRCGSSDTKRVFADGTPAQSNFGV